jgi:hypothetical protein
VGDGASRTRSRTADAARVDFDYLNVEIGDGRVRQGVEDAAMNSRRTLSQRQRVCA